MRAWAFLLSFYLVFGQIYYAHSAFPVAVATAKGVGTLVRSGVIMHGAGALARSSYKWCKANKVKCAGLLGGAYDLIMGDDDDDDGQYCYYLTNYLKSTKASTPLSSCDKYLQFSHVKSVVYDPDIKGGPNDKGKCFVNNKNGYTQYDFWVTKVCEADPDGTKRQEQKERELWDKLKDKLSDDDITNIVNNYGDDIDIDKYCASGATCYFIEPEFEKEINNNDYDIDKIDDKNCNTRNGKIYSCPNAKKKKDKDDDDDGQTNKDNEKDKDNPTLPNIPSINIPRFCTWAKPVCDWLDWSKEPLKDQDTRLNIPSPSGDSIDTNINASGSCPTDIVIQGTFAGRQFEFFRFEWSKFCQWLFIIKPIIIAMASFGAVKIVGGVNVAD